MSRDSLKSYYMRLPVRQDVGSVCFGLKFAHRLLLSEWCLHRFKPSWCPLVPENLSSASELANTFLLDNFYFFVSVIGIWITVGR